MSYYDGEFKAVIGKPLASVELADDKERIVFRFEDGTEAAYRAEGDCCSHSWIEHLTVPTDVAGATITAVKEESESGPEDAKDADGYSYESLQVYHTAFVTDRGEIILEYRNSSNGYYGGYLVEVA